MRRAWYFISVGSHARDAKEVRVFGLGDFFADRFRADYVASIRAGMRACAGCTSGPPPASSSSPAARAGRLGDHDAARVHEIGVRTMSIILPMLAVTAAVGSVSMDDITLAWTLFGLPDVDRLERDLRPPSELDGSGDPGGAPRPRYASVRSATATRPARRTCSPGSTSSCAAGTSTAIVGVNGAGKSTLVSRCSRRCATRVPARSPPTASTSATSTRPAGSAPSRSCRRTRLATR